MESTNEKLARLGYTTEPARLPGSKHVMKAGEVVFAGNCFEVNQFIETRQPDALFALIHANGDIPQPNGPA